MDNTTLLHTAYASCPKLYHVVPISYVTIVVQSLIGFVVSVFLNLLDRVDCIAKLTTYLNAVLRALLNMCSMPGTKTSTLRTYRAFIMKYDLESTHSEAIGLIHEYSTQAKSVADQFARLWVLRAERYRKNEEYVKADGKGHITILLTFFQPSSLLYLKCILVQVFSFAAAVLRASQTDGSGWDKYNTLAMLLFNGSFAKSIVDVAAIRAVRYFGMRRCTMKHLIIFFAYFIVHLRGLSMMSSVMLLSPFFDDDDEEAAGTQPLQVGLLLLNVLWVPFLFTHGLPGFIVYYPLPLLTVTAVLAATTLCLGGIMLVRERRTFTCLKVSLYFTLLFLVNVLLSYTSSLPANYMSMLYSNHQYAYKTGYIQTMFDELFTRSASCLYMEMWANVLDDTSRVSLFLQFM